MCWNKNLAAGIKETLELNKQRTRTLLATIYLYYSILWDMKKAQTTPQGSSFAVGHDGKLGRPDLALDGSFAPTISPYTRSKGAWKVRPTSPGKRTAKGGRWTHDKENMFGWVWERNKHEKGQVNGNRMLPAGATYSSIVVTYYWYWTLSGVNYCNAFVQYWFFDDPWLSDFISHAFGWVSECPYFFKSSCPTNSPFFVEGLPFSCSSWITFSYKGVGVTMVARGS